MCACSAQLVSCTSPERQHGRKAQNPADYLYARSDHPLWSCLGPPLGVPPTLPHLRQPPRQRLDHHRLHPLQRLTLGQQTVKVGAQCVALSLEGKGRERGGAGKSYQGNAYEDFSRFAIKGLGMAREDMKEEEGVNGRSTVGGATKPER